MELFIGLVGLGVLVAVVRRWWTNFQYTDMFGVKPGSGTWKARYPFINQELELMVEEVDRQMRAQKELEQACKSADHDEDRVELMKKLDQTVRRVRDAKFAVRYACLIVERREGFLRARNLLGTHQWLKPKGLQR